MSSAEALVREYFRAVNAEDWEALARVWTADCELVAVGGPPRLGREAVVGAYVRFMAMFPVHHDEPVRLLVSGETITVEVHFTAMNRAGDPVELDCVDVIDFRDNQFRRLTFWCDLDILRRQLPTEHGENAPRPDEAGRNAIIRTSSKEHLRQYLESEGRAGGVLRGAPICVLTTTGRKSGARRSVPLMFARDGDTVVLVASLGGAQEHPYWYQNLCANPEAEVQVGAVKTKATAHTASGEERRRLWALTNAVYPTYEEYQSRTTREIPVVVLVPHP